MDYFVDKNGGIYVGAMVPGDRLATDEEVAAHRKIVMAVHARSKRDALLGIADRLFNTLSDLKESTDAVSAYRVALRNVPAQEGFPETIEWPPIPQGLYISASDQAQIAGFGG